MRDKRKKCWNFVHQNLQKWQAQRHMKAILKNPRGKNICRLKNTWSDNYPSSVIRGLIFVVNMCSVPCSSKLSLIVHDTVCFAKNSNGMITSCSGRRLISETSTLFVCRQKPFGNRILYYSISKNFRMYFTCIYLQHWLTANITK